MAASFLLALLGTLSTLFGILFFTMGGPVEHPTVSINGWVTLFGLACYALSAIAALRVARGRWLTGRDAVWPLAWSLSVAALALWLGAEVLATIVGPFVPGRYPWFPIALGGAAALCVGAVCALVAMRIVMSIVRAGQQLADR